VQTDSESDDTLIRYLRGELSEAERDRLEELYFTDDKFHDRLAMLEDQMIDSCVRDELPPDQEQRIRRRAHTSVSQRRKLEFAEALRRAADREVGSPKRSWLEALQGFWQVQTRARQMALAAAAVVAIGASFLYFQYAKRSQTPAQQAVAPNPQPVPKSPAPDTAPQPVVPILAFTLSPLERSGGEENRVTIPAGAYTIRLQLDLEDSNSDLLSASVKTAEGAIVDQIDRLAPRRIGSGLRAVFVNLPSSRLRNGQYVIRLSHQTAGGATEVVGGYSFVVENAR